MGCDRYEGPLEKKGGWDGNQFQPRHFTLHGRTLRWYRDKADKPRKTIVLTRFIPDSSARTFQLHCTETRAPYVVRAKTADSFLGWLAALECAFSDQSDHSPSCSSPTASLILDTDLTADEGHPFCPLAGENKRLEIFHATASARNGRTVKGTIIVSNFRLFCCGCSIPLGSLLSMEASGRNLTMCTRSLERFRCTVVAIEDVEILILKLHTLNVPFAFEHYQALVMRDGPNIARHWQYNTEAEFQRMGIVDDPVCPWRIEAELNANYRLCPTYPCKMVVPRDATAETLSGAASFRTKRRFPILTWRCAQTGYSLCRSAEPGTVVGNREADKRLLDSVRTASRCPTLAIFDCRTRIAATGNAVNITKETLGGTEWLYPNTDVLFCGLPNIHKVREYYSRMRLGDADAWHASVRELLATTQDVCRELGDRSVLVHCTDGWDRTAQVCALAQLLLDPYYRTIVGLATLVEKEWVRGGHKFGDRCGNHLSGIDIFETDPEQAPIFLQWLWAVYQLGWHHPSQFEFNALLLHFLAEHHQSLLYGTFLGNSERERRDAGVEDSTVAIWDIICHPERRHHFMNPKYRPTGEALSGVIPRVQHWCGNPGLQTSFPLLRSSSKEQLSAMLIQRAYRLHLRQRMTQILPAVLTIQRAWRGVQDRHAQQAPGREDPEPLHMRGWLKCRADGAEEAKDRYFLLHSTLLRWFKDADLKVPCGSVDLRCCAILSRHHDCGVFTLSGPEVKLELECTERDGLSVGCKWQAALEGATQCRGNRHRRPLSVGVSSSPEEDSLQSHLLRALQSSCVPKSPTSARQGPQRGANVSPSQARSGGQSPLVTQHWTSASGAAPLTGTAGGTLCRRHCAPLRLPNPPPPLLMPADSPPQ
eukprot:GGOE01062262.1.p1 GENE.GGOE01062262.1~~GGOE01062262.1.p1  ORF type:complete len:877 (-),score=204.90 GGOE01062262.1:179-2809(-)